VSAHVRSICLPRDPNHEFVRVMTHATVGDGAWAWVGLVAGNTTSPPLSDVAYVAYYPMVVVALLILQSTSHRVADLCRTGRWVADDPESLASLNRGATHRGGCVAASESRRRSTIAREKGVTVAASM
jgi:hypothetical protein